MITCKLIGLVMLQFSFPILQLVSKADSIDTFKILKVTGRKLYLAKQCATGILLLASCTESMFPTGVWRTDS